MAKCEWCGTESEELYEFEKWSKTNELIRIYEVCDDCYSILWEEDHGV